MHGKSLALIAAAAATTVAGMVSKTQAQVYYRPVVTLVGDGTAADDPLFAGNNNAGIATIQVYNYGLAGQASPLAQNSYLSDGSANSLVDTSASSTEATLTNNPALADAATAGLPYSGTAYVFSGGYQGTNQENAINSTGTNANRVIGFMSVTGNSVSSGTIGESSPNSSTYTGGNLRGVVGDDTATNFWAAGTGTNTSPNFSAAYRYSNTNTQLSTSSANARQVQIRQGQLYGGADTGNFVGISLIGVNPNPANTSGLPTSLTSPGVVNLFETSGNQTGLANSGIVSPYSFVLMKDPNNSNTPTLTVAGNPVSIPFNVAYVADANNGNTSDVTSGIQKWVYNPGTTTNNGWSLSYTITDSVEGGNPAADLGDYGLAAELIPNASNSLLDSVRLYATDVSPTGPANSLVQFTDSLEGSLPTDLTTTESSEVVLATAPANEAFRGVALAPIVPVTSQWGSATGGTWSIGTNWTAQTPGIAGDLADTALFGANLGSSGIVTLDSNRTVGHVVFNNSAASYTLAASSGAVLTIDDTGGTGNPDITVIAGSHTISAPISLANGVNVLVTPGTSLTVSNTITGSGNVAVNGGGKLVMGVGGKLNPISSLSISGATVQLASSSGLQTLAGLSIASGTLDVGNNHIIINYGALDPSSSIYSYLQSGYSGGAWTGAGIDSSTAALPANSAHYGVGFVDGADHVPGASVSSGQIEVAYALYGDVNLDGFVNATDFAVFGANFNKSITGWDHGDFTYSGLINGTDFALLGSNFGKTASGTAVALPASDWAALDAFAVANGLSVPTSVPEPGSIGLLAAGAFGLSARRRRRSR